MFVKQFKLLIHWAYEHDNSPESVLDGISVWTVNANMLMVTHAAKCMLWVAVCFVYSVLAVPVPVSMCICVYLYSCVR